MSVENYDYDVLYLGSGHGTFDGAIPLAAKGLRLRWLKVALSAEPAPIGDSNAKITLDRPLPYNDNWRL